MIQEMGQLQMVHTLECTNAACSSPSSMPCSASAGCHLNSHYWHLTPRRHANGTGSPLNTNVYIPLSLHSDGNHDGNLAQAYMDWQLAVQTRCEAQGYHILYSSSNPN